MCLQQKSHELIRLGEEYKNELSQFIKKYVRFPSSANLGFII